MTGHIGRTSILDKVLLVALVAWYVITRRGKRDPQQPHGN